MSYLKRVKKIIKEDPDLAKYADRLSDCTVYKLGKLPEEVQQALGMVVPVLRKNGIYAQRFAFIIVAIGPWTKEEWEQR